MTPVLLSLLGLAITCAILGARLNNVTSRVEQLERRGNRDLLIELARRRQSMNERTEMHDQARRDAQERGPR